MEYRLHLIKRSDIRQEIGRTDVPVRIARTIVQVQVIRPNMQTVVTVTADKGRESRNTPDTASYIPYIKFYKKPSACRRRISEAFPLRSSPLLLRSDRLF